MRIAQYHPRALVGDGGITNSVHRLSMALAQQGAEPLVICDDADVPTPSNAVEWVRLQHVGIGALRAPLGLAKVLGRVDLLVCNSAWTGHNVVAARTARAQQVPYILAPRGAYDPRIRRRRKLLKDIWWAVAERDLVARCRAVHVFFEEERPHLAAIGYGGDLLIAPNGVAVPEGASWDGGSGGYLLYLGRFDPEHKGLDVLLRAVAATTPGAIPPLRLHGPDWRGGKDVVRDLIRQLGIGDRVTVGPAVYGTDKWDLLGAATGFVYPSRWEGFGNSTAEAAALGIPTLVTPYPLGRHLASSGAAILSELTEQGLVVGLQQLCNADAAAVGRRAARVVRDELSWDAVASAWLRQSTALVGETAA